MKIPNRLVALLLVEGALLSSVSGKYANTRCQADSDCGLETHLQCINNYCQCDSHTQIYDQSTEKCLLLIGQECQSPLYTATSNGQYYRDESTPPIKCVPNADCTKSVCRCKQGYKASLALDLLCKPDFGSPCYQKDDCDDSLGLVCSRGTCQCFNDTWTYQGQFGCVDPKDPTYNEMLRLLNQTHYLLKENNLEIRDMFNELGLQNDPKAEHIFGNAIADERQFRNNYNNNQDLQFAAQNQNSQTSGGGGNGFNLQQLLSLFQTLQSFIPRNNNNGNNSGGGNNGGSPALGFLRTLGNIFRPNNNNNNNNNNGPGGYQDNNSQSSNGYGGSGQPENMGQRMGLINSFLNLFNQLIPVVRQLKMRFSPWRFIQNVLNRIVQNQNQNSAGPPAPALYSPPPTVIQASGNGNFQNNPIFDNNNPNAGNQNSQGQGTFRFFMRSRDRFRNLLRGNSNQGQNQNNGGGGGYDLSPSTNYGAPQGPPPGSDGAPAPPPPPPQGEASAGSNFYSNNIPPNPNRPSSGPGSYRIQQEEFNTITVGVTHSNPPGTVSSSSSSTTTTKVQPATAAQRYENQQNFGGPPRPSTYTTGQHPNHQSFFGGGPQPPQHQSSVQQTAQAQPHQQFHNNQLQHTNNSPNNYNAQATSHHQSTFVPHPQPTSYQRPPAPDQSPSIYATSSSNSNNQNSYHTPESSGNRPPSVLSLASTPPPIPQFKLPVPSQKTIASIHESIAQNYILSEADDPHPGFTPHSTSAPSVSPAEDQYQPQVEQHQGFRTSARFERIGEEDEQSRSAADNWRESF